MIEKFMWKAVSYKIDGHNNQKPCPRWGHSCCTIGEEVVLFGGYAESVYMNDLWAFNTVTMQWREIKTQGTIPSPRSNCSANYDIHNNKIYFFGGGGSNKVRFNSISVLDWETKTWTEIKYQQNQKLPWQRTYHTAELLYPYLIVYGGQGIADLDDLWVFNFQTGLWREIKASKSQVKPCGRRFHSSCLIGNQFFVIAGCHTKYRCLNDIYSIDLTKLLESGDFQSLVWKQRGAKGTALLSRWGHSSATYNNKIYIFGGRFSTDLNDLLIFDPRKQTLKMMKIAPETLPKPRRRPSTCFIGSCMLMFGGFNSDYYNDLHFINISENFVKAKNYQTELKQSQKIQYIEKLMESREKNIDFYMQSSDNKVVPCHKDLILINFEEQWQSIKDLLMEINTRLSYKELCKVMQSLYLGYSTLQIFQHHKLDLPKNPTQKLKKTHKTTSQKLITSESISSIIKNKSINGIMQLNDQKFGEMIERNRETIRKDVAFVINNNFVLESNSILLSLNNKYFRALFHNYSENRFKDAKQFVPITIPSNNIVLFEIVLNSIMFGILTVPMEMSYQSWMELYELADYFCMSELKQVCIYQLSLRLNNRSLESIYKFCREERIRDLGLMCAKYKINELKNMPQQSIVEPYLKEVYKMHKFQIFQNDIMTPQPKLHKYKSQITQNSQGQKQNYEICN